MRIGQIRWRPEGRFRQVLGAERGPLLDNRGAGSAPGQRRGGRGRRGDGAVQIARRCFEGGSEGAFHLRSVGGSSELWGRLYEVRINVREGSVWAGPLSHMAAMSTPTRWYPKSQLVAIVRPNAILRIALGRRMATSVQLVDTCRAMPPPSPVPDH